MSVKRTVTKGSSFSRVYENMRGVDLSVDVSPDGGRYAYLENMYVDYEGSGELESIPGYRHVYSFYRKIYGIFPQKLSDAEYLIIHAGKNLYRFNVDDRDALSSLSPIYKGMAEQRSSSLVFDNKIYIFDGAKIITVSQSGTAAAVTSFYAPFITLNGEKYEGRNLLTPNFRAKYILNKPEEYSYGTPGLEYRITDYDDRTCALVGIGSSEETSIHVPSYTLIGGTRYRVKSIANTAFSGNTSIKELYTNSGLEDLGYRSFYNCTSLTFVSLAKTVKSIGIRCFENCSSLATLYIGAEFKSFGEHSLDLCTSLHEIEYALSEDDLDKISGTEYYEDRFINFNVTYRKIQIVLPYPPNYNTITALTLSGEKISFTLASDGIMIDENDRDIIEGHELIIYGQQTDAGDGFLASTLGQLLTPVESILGCRLAVSYDGRIFITGNSSLPGLIFYSGTTGEGVIEPLYFSTDNFLSDGNGSCRVSSLIPGSDGLSAILSDSGGGGSICLHKGEGEGLFRRYPISYTVNGIPSTGDAIFFMGETLFISSQGLTTGIVDSDGSLVGLENRSGAISKALSSEELENIRLCEWCGYLVLSSGGKMYLADSRSKYKDSDGYNYDWYCINGIGSYLNTSPIIRYHTLPKEGYILSDTPDAVAEGEVLSEGEDLESLILYIETPKGRVRVYISEETAGSSLSPATEIMSTGNLLFFGTNFGEIFVFNNDKRGVPPEYVTEEADFDADDYALKMGKRIHPYYYKFNSVNVKYTLLTPADSGGYPDLEKTSEGASALKFLNLSAAEISISVRDRDGSTEELCRIHSGSPDFSKMDFSRFSFSTADCETLAFSDRKRGFTEKQYVITSDGIKAPIGINSLAYRYKIKGRIRNK